MQSDELRAVAGVRVGGASYTRRLRRQLYAWGEELILKGPVRRQFRRMRSVVSRALTDRQGPPHRNRSVTTTSTVPPQAAGGFVA